MTKSQFPHMQTDSPVAILVVILVIVHYKISIVGLGKEFDHSKFGRNLEKLGGNN